MNTPTPIQQAESAVSSTASADLTKAKAWLGSNWYPFGIGVTAATAIVKVAHLAGLLKFL